MLPDLEHLIRLQEIETRAAEARKRIADAPGEIAALDARLAAAREAVTAAKQTLADNQTARRAIEKDLASVQQRLSKYKEQLMEVKTNPEYHAMQHQIAAANAEVARFEEQILVNMLEADDLGARLKAAEATLKNDESAVAQQRSAIQTDAADRERILAESVQERTTLLPQITRNHVEMFERVFKARQGIAVAEAIDGHCSICHVRLRPQVYNTILRNEHIVQCDHCQRVLYFSGVHQRSAAGHAAVDAAHSRQIDHDGAP
jgi:hypothetical protein